MKEERIEILKMLHEGVISVEEAEKLLSALNSGENKTRNENQYRKHQNHPFEGNFFGESFFKGLDKGLSGMGKMCEGIFGNFNDFHPYKKNDETYRDFESVYSANGQIIIEPGDILEIRQQVNRRLNGSCDVELIQTKSKDIFVDSDENNSYEIKRKDNIIVIICYDDCRISVPEELKEISLKLLNGDIEIKGLHCPFSAETLNGDIRMENCKKVIDVKSLSGDIEYIISSDYEGHCQISTLSGDVQLFIPDSFSGIINAKAMSGEIICDLNDNISIKKESNIVQEKQTIEINGASPDNIINCSTLSGDIEIESV